MHSAHEDPARDDSLLLHQSKSLGCLAILTVCRQRSSRRLPVLIESRKKRGAAGQRECSVVEAKLQLLDVRSEPSVLGLPPAPCRSSQCGSRNNVSYHPYWQKLAVIRKPPRVIVRWQSRSRQARSIVCGNCDVGKKPPATRFRFCERVSGTSLNNRQRQLVELNLSLNAQTKVSTALSPK